MPIDTILLGDRELKISSRFDGRLDKGTVRGERIVIGGWVTARDRDGAPFRIAIVVGGKEVAGGELNVERADYQRLKAATPKCGFEYYLPIGMADLVAKSGLYVYAYDKESASQLSIYRKGYLLADLTPPASLQTFSEIYQFPQTRIQDDEFLAFATERFSNDVSLPFSKRASAVVVRLYLLINGRDFHSAKKQNILALAESILRTSGEEQDRFQRIRWIGSVSLACAYVEIGCRKLDAAIKHLQALVSLANDIPASGPFPGMHTLTGHLLLSYILWKRGEVAKSLEVIKPMASLVVRAIQEQGLDRFWAVPEEQAYHLKILSEALALKNMLSPGSVLYVPEGRQVQLKNLKQPIPWLVENGCL